MRIRTGYSFKTAFGHLKDVSDRLDSIGLMVRPITDRASTFGFVEWTKLAKAANKHPVYGIELGVVQKLGDLRPIVDYWTFLAKDNLFDLHQLFWTATKNPGKEPTLTYAQALEAKGVIRIVGEKASIDLISRSVDTYFSLSPSLPKSQFTAVKAAGMQFIAQSDNYYPQSNDKELYRIALGKRSNTQSYPMYILSDEEWHKAVEWFAPEQDRQEAIKNRNSALDTCRAELMQAQTLIPDKPKTLRQMCIEGATKLGCSLDNQVYQDRLTRELDLIEQKKFEDYFYIIADLVNWAKDRMIVGPARGSSCGSLVCYLLGITSIDPIPFELIFERFIDITRKDLPDIDIDFSDVNRNLVFKYAEEKYGKERVARLGTVGLFQPRSILNQAGISLRIPKWQIEKVLDGQVIRSGGDARAMQQLEDTIKDTEAGRKLLKDYPAVLDAARMEGHPNNASQHAAGLVITNDSVSKYVAVDFRTNAAMCDKYDAETLNLLKIDMLGLTQLSIFERTLELLGIPPKNGYLEKLPLDDVAAFEVLNKQHFSGIFQFMGGALKSITKQFKVKHIDDIIAVTALARPGPMASGGANSWVKRKTGQEKITYPHELFIPYMKDTLGIVIYQEQVMQIGREIGDLSWDDVTALRKAMSKSLGKEFFDQFGDRWKAAAIAKGIEPEVLEKVWDDLCAYGSWAFNKSHSVAYGIVSYWCCWLKAHHPMEFAAATLDAEADPARQIQMLRELKEEGIDYVPVDAEKSVARWTPAERDGKRILVGPLTSIKGVGPASVAKVLDCRKRGLEIPSGIAKKLAQAKTDIDSIYPVRDAIKQMDLQRLKIISEPLPIRSVQCGVKGEVMVIGILTKINQRDENEAINIAKRKGKVITSGPTASLNLFCMDDSDEVFCKIDRYKFEDLGRKIVEYGKAGRAIYAIKGTIPDFFRMISVTNIRHLGDLDNIDLRQNKEQSTTQTETVDP